MKGVKPLYYQINDDKNFVCPLCGSKLLIELRTLTNINNNGKLEEFFSFEPIVRLICSKCGNDMTNQLNSNYNNGKFSHYNLINLEDKENTKINYNYNKKDSFFKEE